VKTPQPSTAPASSCLRLALLVGLSWPAGLASGAGGWQPDGFHVFPGESIQSGLDAAARNPTNKVVKVHAGVYRPDSKRQALIWLNRQHDGITLEAIGNVTLSAANPEISQPESASHPAVVNHVVYFGDGVSPQTILRGFKITGAHHFVTTDGPEVEPNRELKRNLFFYADGGAVKIFGHSSPTLQHLEIADNYASPCAGGISVQQEVIGASPGGDPVRIEDCIFRQNRSQITGAAVDLLPGSSAVLSNCLFVGNLANLGANYIAPNPAQPEFTNSAPLTVFPSSRAVVLQCTFAGNRNGIEDLGSHSQYRDCIFWRNNLPGGFYASERYELSLSDNAKVSGCWIAGPVLDSRGTISRQLNRFDGFDPQFDRDFNPASSSCQGAGFRMATK